MTSKHQTYHLIITHSKLWDGIVDHKNKIRNEFLWYLITQQKIDIIIEVEIWMKNSIEILNTEYKLIQTTCSNYQDVWIIYKENLNVNFEYSDNNTGWVLVSSIKANKKIVAYIIGIYKRTENKKEITEEKTDQS